jgi:hypothetical protein
MIDRFIDERCPFQYRKAIFLLGLGLCNIGKMKCNWFFIYMDWENMNQDKKIDCKVLQKFNPVLEM